MPQYTVRFTQVYDVEADSREAAIEKVNTETDEPIDVEWDVEGVPDDMTADLECDEAKKGDTPTKTQQQEESPGEVPELDEDTARRLAMERISQWDVDELLDFVGDCLAREYLTDEPEFRRDWLIYMEHQYLEELP